MSILKYFFWIPIVFLSIEAGAQTNGQQVQNTEVDSSAADTLAGFTPEPFVRVGFDLSAVARQFIETEVQQFEFSIDSEIIYNWFAVVEGGVLDVEADRDDFKYTANGYFGRLGIDYNLLRRPNPSQNDLVLLGIRYGFSQLSHEAPSFIVPNPYWGTNTEGSTAQSNFTLHWIEFSGGVKTEVFRNVFLGWYLKSRIKLSQTKDPELFPYYIGGFGQGKRRAPLMIHFSVLYRLGI